MMTTMTTILVTQIRVIMKTEMEMETTATHPEITRLEFQFGETGIWLRIDAVCIDQTNVEGRNRQVLLMSNICQDAEEVVAWLEIDAANT